MTVVPWLHIHDLDVEGFKREGDRSIIELGRRSKFEVNWMTREYSVVVDDVEIANQQGTFCPIDEDRVAFFSRESRRLQAVLPSGWDATRITALALHADHREPVPVNVNQNQIVIDVPADRAIMVYRDADAAAKHHIQ